MLLTFPTTTQLLQFIQNHWLLWLGFIVVLGLLFFEEFKKSFRSSNILIPQEAIKLINRENAIVIDMRDNQAFKNGHIVNSHNVQKGDIEKHPQKLAHYKEKNIILIATTEQEAQKIAKHLKLHGFGKIYVLSEGINAWQNANLPIVKK